MHSSRTDLSSESAENVTHPIMKGTILMMSFCSLVSNETLHVCGIVTTLSARVTAAAPSLYSLVH